MLTITPDLGLHRSVYEQMLVALPEGKFYLKGKVNVPYGSAPFPFIVSTTSWDQPLSVYVNNVRQVTCLPLDVGTVRKTTAVSQGFYVKLIVNLKLAEGQNTIRLVNGSEQNQLGVTATRIFALLWVLARDIFENVTLPIHYETIASLSPWSSHFIEPLVSYTPLMPDEKVARIHGFRKATYGGYVNPVTEIGINDFINGLTYGNPVFKQITADGFGTMTLNLERSAMLFSGYDLHVWITNKKLAAWLAFAKLVDNLKHVFTVGRISPGEVILVQPQRGIRDKNGDLITEYDQFQVDKLGPDLNGVLKDIYRIDFALHVTQQSKQPTGSYRWTYNLDQKVNNPQGTRVLNGKTLLDGTHKIPLDDGVDILSPFLPGVWVHSESIPGGTSWRWRGTTGRNLTGWRGFPITSRRFAPIYQTDHTTSPPTYNAAPLNTMSGYYRPLPPKDAATFPVAPLTGQKVHLIVPLPGYPVSFYDYNGVDWIAYQPPYVWLDDPAVSAAMYAELLGAVSPNGDVRYHRAHPGELPIRVQHVVAGLNTLLTVSVSGTDITVNVATNGLGIAISTAESVAAAVNISAAAALVTAVAQGNGTGLVAAVAFTDVPYFVRMPHVVYFSSLPALGNTLGDVRKVEYDGRDYWWNGTRWLAVKYWAHPQLGGPQLRDLIEVRMDHEVTVTTEEAMIFISEVQVSDAGGGAGVNTPIPVGARWFTCGVTLRGGATVNDVTFGCVQIAPPDNGPVYSASVNFPTMPIVEHCFGGGIPDAIFHNNTNVNPATSVDYWFRFYQ